MNFTIIKYWAKVSGSVQFSCLVVSSSLKPYELQHARLLCPPLSPGVCSNLCPLSPWLYLIISSSVFFSFCLSSFPASGSIPMSWPLHIMWPKYWNFSFSIEAFELWWYGRLLDSEEIKPVHPKGNQSWIFIERTDAEASILWPPDVKS